MWNWQRTGRGAGTRELSYSHASRNDGECRCIFEGKGIEALGVGSFGPIDPIEGSNTYGYITTTPKPHWGNYNLIGKLKEHFDVPMGFDTDVNGAALGESIWGRPRDWTAVSILR